MIYRVLTMTLMLALSTVCSAQDRAPRSAGLRVSTGVGVGSRAFALPTSLGVEQLRTAPFATAEASVGYRLWPERRLGVDLIAEYRTSLAWTLEQRPLFALPERIEARSQRIAASISPRLRFASAANRVIISLPLGFGMSSFWPRPRQFPVRDFVLAGPLVRAELQFEIAQRVSVRLGPELQWLLLSSPSLRNSGLEPSAGLTLAGEAALEVRVSTALRLALCYRESHARVPSTTSALEDSERYATARISGEL